MINHYLTTIEPLLTIKHPMKPGKSPSRAAQVVARQRFALTPRTTATVLLVESRPLQAQTLDAVSRS